MNWRKGTPLDETLQEKLRKLVRERGEKAAAALLEIGQISVLRGAAGAGMRRGTAFWIKTKLDELTA